MLGAIANLWHNPESRIEVEDVQQHIMVSHPYKHSKCMVPWGLLRFARPFTLRHAAKKKKTKKHVPSHLLKDPPFPPLPIPLPLTHISLPFPTLLKSDDGGTIAGDI